MKPVTFDATILAGHKEAAVEVPFDPAVAWKAPAKPLWKGRRGHLAKGAFNGVAFESFVVSRSRRFWLLVSPEMLAQSETSVGETVSVAIQPMD